MTQPEALNLDAEQALKISFTLKREDLLAFKGFHLLAFRRAMILYCFAAYATVLTGLTLLLSYRHFGHALGMGLVAAIPVIGLVLAAAATALHLTCGIRLRTRRMMDEIPEQNRTIRFEVWPQGIVVCHDNGCSRYTWQNVIQIRETKQLYVFYVARSVAHIVPKSIFGSVARQRLFLSLCLDRWQRAKGADAAVTQMTRSATAAAGYYKRKSPYLSRPERFHNHDVPMMPQVTVTRLARRLWLA